MATKIGRPGWWNAPDFDDRTLEEPDRRMVWQFLAGKPRIHRPTSVTPAGRSVPISVRRHTELLVSPLCLGLLLAVLWLATRPYVGVVQDGRFYTVQALRALTPGDFANDLYFQFGSQDQFTLFTLIYKPVLAIFGLAKAAMLLTIVGEVCWIGGLVYLAYGLFPQRVTVLVAVATAIALPSGVMFEYGESFLTPRLFAEAVTLWALGSMVRGKSIRALLLLVFAVTLHPIMTLAGFAMLFLYEAGNRRLWWILALGAGVGALALACWGVQPFARLRDAFDPEWFAVVQVRDFFCLLTKWTALHWLKVGNLVALSALGLLAADSRQRRFLFMAIAVAGGGLLVTLIGGDVLRNVLVVDAQQYRATWLLAIMANLFIGPLLLRAYRNAGSAVFNINLTLAIGTLIITRFVPAGYLFTMPVVMLVGILQLGEYFQRPTSPVFGMVITAIVGAAFGFALIAMYAYLSALAAWDSQFWLTVRGLVLTMAALIAITLHTKLSGSCRSITNLLLIAFTLSLIGVAAFTWDQRTPWTRFVESPGAAQASLSSVLPARKPIYWEGDVRMPWFVLQRSDYFSCAQGTGALFFRGTAITYQHRYNSLKPLATLDFGQETTCPPAGRLEQPQFNRSEIKFACEQEPQLGALVLTRPVAEAMGDRWISPAPFEDVRFINGRLRVFRTDTFFIYPCATFR